MASAAGHPRSEKSSQIARKSAVYSVGVVGEDGVGIRHTASALVSFQCPTHAGRLRHRLCDWRLRDNVVASPKHEKMEQLFSAALEKDSSAEQNAFLKSACGADIDLRTRVEALLQAHDRVGSFLDVPPIDTDATLESRAPGEVTGTKIGRYKILQKIGEGGFGSVYMAEQEEPVRRKVALKIIKLGMDTKQVIARFEAERQALALMDHPNIARVFDAGATETGRPYFVMELVKGVTVTEYCDQNKLSIRDRLAIFIPVCHAVQHAHQKGIIHRDLKPGNVLVDTHGKPHVLDGTVSLCLLYAQSQAFGNNIQIMAGLSGKCPAGECHRIKHFKVA